MKRKNRIKYPEIYQGRKNLRQYFEGWYFRHTSEDTEDSLIVIPGVSFDKNDSHAFIQIITGNPQTAYYVSFDLSEFFYSKENFSLKIANNTFSTDGIHLDINSDGLILKGDISYGNFSKIDRTLLTPNIMGFFAYFRLMECNHGIVSLRHKVSGIIEYNGSFIKYDNGLGYIEKDWGTSFPKKYIWMQANHFEKNTGFFLSIARIPFLGLVFNGFISILSINQKQYRFATYNGSKFKISSLDTDFILIELKRHRQKVLIKAESNSGHVLKAPRRGKMSDEITETVTANISIEFFENDICIYKDSGTNLGLELVW